MDWSCNALGFLSTSSKVQLQLRSCVKVTSRISFVWTLNYLGSDATKVLRCHVFQIPPQLNSTVCNSTGSRDWAESGGGRRRERTPNWNRREHDIRGPSPTLVNAASDSTVKYNGQTSSVMAQHFTSMLFLRAAAAAVQLTSQTCRVWGQYPVVLLETPRVEMAWRA